jgi:hypothetical protein
MSQENVDLVAEGLRAFQATLRAAVSQRGRPKGSQSWVHLRFGVVWTVADGELKRGRVFRTAEEALEAAGLRG